MCALAFCFDIGLLSRTTNDIVAVVKPRIRDPRGLRTLPSEIPCGRESPALEGVFTKEGCISHLAMSKGRLS